MKNLSVVTGVAALLSAGPALAQSLCNPCVDPPTNGTTIRSPGSSPTNVITAQEMQELGVVSVADMINQLPAGVADIRPDSTAGNGEAGDDVTSTDAAPEEVSAESSASDSDQAVSGEDR